MSMLDTALETGLRLFDRQRNRQCRRLVKASTLFAMVTRGDHLDLGAAPACGSFAPNVWRPTLCSNCYRGLSEVSRDCPVETRWGIKLATSAPSMYHLQVLRNFYVPDPR